MSRPLRSVLRGTALLGIIAVGAGPATATDGSLYPYGSSVWATSAQFRATVLGGPVWQVQAPALSPAAAGNHWEMNWGCPVPGSEIAAVRFGALRTREPSSLAVRVTGDRQVLWEEGDVGMPMSPAGGRAYDVALPGGHCNVHLALAQVEARAQHPRGYFIDNPRVLVRDIAPPSVLMRTLSSGWLGAGAGLRVDWSVDDNFGGDGVGVQRVVVAGQVRWAGTPGVGDVGLDLPLEGIGDGVHGVEVRVDGDGTGGATADGVIHVDRTPPAASGLSATPTAQPGTLALAWSASDNLSGVTESAVEINVAVDGGVGGSWLAVAATRGAGARQVTVAAAGVPDGVHAWRVRTVDAAGNVALTPGPGPVIVSTTPPRLDLHGVPSGWVGRAEVDLTATDDLEDALGPPLVEIDVNAAPDGGEHGEWQRRGASSGPAGRRIVPVDLAGLAPGRHAVRVVARNAGPGGAALATERRAVIRVDRERPTISHAGFSTGPGRPLTVSWVAEDAHAGVAVASVQWRDAGIWRTLATGAATDGAGRMVIDVAALPAGERGLRVLVSDGAGNATARAGSAILPGAGGIGSAASDGLARLRTARLAVRVAGARATRRAGRRVLVRRIVIGGVIAIRGRLRDRAGRGIVGREVQARGHRGRLVGRALTRRGGAFTLLARPLAGGRLRIGVRVGGRLLPERSAVAVDVEVRPRIALAASTTLAATGERVLFTGRLRPAPGDLGLGSRKGIVLQWLDPIRRSWRPVVNARIRRDGTFAIPWAFGLRGMTIPMRVVVPSEVGWPLLPVRSRVTRVRVV